MNAVPVTAARATVAGQPIKATFNKISLITHRAELAAVEIKAGYVKDDVTEVCFGLTREFHSHFDSLSEGVGVVFYGNAYNAVAQFGSIG